MLYEMMEMVKDLSPEEFLRLARVLYEEGQKGSFGEPSCREFKARMTARITTWLEG